MTSAIAAPRRSTTAVDISMLVLAVFSLGLLCYAMFFDTSPETAHAVFVIDTAICGVFFVEFLWRWRGTGWQRRFPLASWYEILGMIPVAHPALRGFRLLRVVVVLMRLARTADRAFGERVTQRVIERFSRPIVLAIKKPITVAVLDEVVKVVETGHYPENVARSLGEHREVLREIVTEKLKNDQQVGRIKHLPFHDEIVKSIVDTTIRVILDVLNDERTDQFFTEVVRENRDQIRRSVQLGLHETDPDPEPPADPTAYRAEYR
ncbi:ion transporter [Saccharopolyspora sp. TS4A08]|uniref:Ion transporter n=1 Tax=Saccharopolyspora ipomoeae TaxID=3042027 RepID=A0ABT6PPQ8_9PSEU|nr:ion transporter [Saccharopolyspora sp. TS4A08]MDI2029982.1 ion transporter [Saccharopolyspora sp. TS4A08]